MRTRYASVAGGLAVLAALVIGLAVPAGASAAGHRTYRPGAGAKCRAGYVRQVRKHQTWCVYNGPSSKLIPAYPAVGVLPHFGYAGENGVPETPNFLVLLALLATRTGAPAAGSVTVLIEDATAHRTVATLPNVPKVECAIVDTLEGGTFVLKGEAQGGFNRHYPACPLGVASMPATDVPVIRGVFAGNSRYAASTSKPEGMFWTPGNIHHLSQPRAPVTSLPCPGEPPTGPIIIHPPC